MNESRTKSGIILPGQGGPKDKVPIVGRTKLVLAYLHNGTLPHEFMASVFDLSRAVPQVLIIGLEYRVNISEERNRVVKMVLENSDADYLMFVNSDIQFAPADLITLLDERLPIVSGLYLEKSEWRVLPAAGRVVNPIKENKPLTQDDCTKGTIEVCWVGMGFCLIHRPVLEALGVKPLWPFSESVVDEQAVSEDITFCLRVKEKGFKVYLNTDVRVGRIERDLLNPVRFLAAREREQEKKP